MKEIGKLGSDFRGDTKYYRAFVNYSCCFNDKTFLMVKHFSQETIDLIAKSRLVAIDCYCNCISTIHFLLADCELKGAHSIKNFSFRTNEEYLHFYKLQKSTTVIQCDENIRLTVEAENAITNSQLYRRYYSDQYINPCHIFLAACKNKKSLLYSIWSPKDELDIRLENYYIEKGQLYKENINKGLSYQLERFGLFRRNLF